MNKRFSELTVSATDFANDDVIAIDGETNGTRKMSGSALKSAMKSNTLATADSNAYVVSDGDVVRIKDLETSITSFRTGDVIPVDGPSGTAKMNKEDLLNVVHEGMNTACCAISYTSTSFTSKHHTYISCSSGERFLFVFDKSDWSASEYTSGSQIIFEIVATDESGATRSLYYVSADQGVGKIPVRLFVEAGDGDCKLDVSVRADNGHSVNINVFNITPSRLRSDILSTISLSSLRFDGEDSNILKRNIPVSASADYKFVVDKTNWTMNNYTSPSQDLLAIHAVNTSGTLRALFRRSTGQGVDSVPDTINVSTNSDEYQISIVCRADVAKYVGIGMSCTTLGKVTSDVTDLKNNSEINSALGMYSYTLSGEGLKFVYTKKFPVIRGTDYVISRNKDTWNTDSATSPSQSVLSYMCTLDDGSDISLVNYSKRQVGTITNDFVVRVPDNAKLFYIRARIDSGDSVTFTVKNNSAASLDESFSLKTEDFAKISEFTDKFNGAASDSCAFLFFTDPHWLVPDSAGYGVFKWYDVFRRKIRIIKRFASSSPINFVLNGGDWLTQDCTQSSALLRLGYAIGWMKHNFKKLVNLIGNHDTNYQGVVSSDDSSIGTFPAGTLESLIYSDSESKCYGRMVAGLTSVYYFDSGLDNYSGMDDYRWEQVDYFATSLMSEVNPHTIIAVHIIKDSNQIQQFADGLLAVGEAYNSRTSITLNNKTYDFSNATGKVEFAIGGHTHLDEEFTHHGIKCVLTAKAGAYNVEEVTFDLCLADYTARKLECIRYGSGSNRTIDL